MKSADWSLVRSGFTAIASLVCALRDQRRSLEVCLSACAFVMFDSQNYCYMASDLLYFAPSQFKKREEPQCSETHLHSRFTVLKFHCCLQTLHFCMARRHCCSHCIWLVTATSGLQVKYHLAYI